MDRTPPCELEAEATILGNLVLWPAKCSLIIRSLVRKDDFYRPAHQVIFGALCGLLDRGEPTELVALKSELLRLKMLEQVGGVEYLVQIVDVPGPYNAEYYAKKVVASSVSRSCIVACGELVQAAYDREPAESTTKAMSEQAYELAQRLLGGRQSIGDARQVGRWLLEEAKRQEDDPAHLAGLNVGIPHFDRATGGLRPGNYCILAGVTGKGKTTLMLGIIADLCARGHRVLCVSAEMSKEDIVQRIHSSLSGVSLSRIRNARLSDDDWEALRETQLDVDRWKLRITDSGGPTVGDVTTIARQAYQDWGGLDLVCIDYIQKLKARGQSDYSRVSAVSSALKELAMNMHIPVLALAQFDRSVGKEGRRPTLHDLKQSGELENDADIVLLLHHPSDGEVGQWEIGGKSIEYREVWARIAKNRSGPETPWPGTASADRVSIRLRWLRPIVRFDNWEDGLEGD